VAHSALTFIAELIVCTVVCVVCSSVLIRFHHGFRADEWLLHDMESWVASNGRGLAMGRFYTREGKLIVSTAQEGLIRVRSAKQDRERRQAKAKANAAATAAAAAAAATFAASQAAATNGSSVTKKATEDTSGMGPGSKASSPGSFSPVVAAPVSAAPVVPLSSKL
jgi:hypothetical protein